MHTYPHPLPLSLSLSLSPPPSLTGETSIEHSGKEEGERAREICCMENTPTNVVWRHCKVTPHQQHICCYFYHCFHPFPSISISTKRYRNAAGGILLFVCWSVTWGRARQSGAAAPRRFQAMVRVQRVSSACKWAVIFQDLGLVFLILFRQFQYQQLTMEVPCCHNLCLNHAAAAAGSLYSGSHGAHAPPPPRAAFLSSLSLGVDERPSLVPPLTWVIPIQRPREGCFKGFLSKQSVEEGM